MHTNDNFKITSKINALENDIQANMNSPHLNKDECIREEIAFLMNEQKYLQHKLIKDY